MENFGRIICGQKIGRESISADRVVIQGSVLSPALVKAIEAQFAARNGAKGFPPHAPVPLLMRDPEPGSH